MKTLKTLKSESGFTLVEMMVVTGIVAVLSIGFASYLYQQAKQSSANEARQNISQVKINLLNSTGKADVLLASESMQIEDFGAAIVNCPHPCWLDNSNKCIFDCDDPRSGYVCASVTPPCEYVTGGLTH